MAAVEAKSPALDLARQQIELLTGGKAVPVTFQVFADRGDKPDLARVYTGKLDDHADVLTRAQRAGCGVYIVVNQTDGKGRRASNIVRVRAVFVDLDGEPLPKEWPLTPHLVIESSPGRYHVYWFLDPTDDLDAWADTQARLAAFYGGDPKMTDAPRVLRLAGFWHLKGKPFQTRIVSAVPLADVSMNGFGRYSLAEVAEAHPCGYKTPVRGFDVEGHLQEPDGGWDNEADIANAKHFLIEDAPPAIEGEHGNNTTFSVACAVRDYGISEDSTLELMTDHYNERCEPPWEADDLAKIVHNAFRYSQNAPGVRSMANDFNEPVTSKGKKKTDLNIPMKPVSWLWDDTIVNGALTLLAGAQGEGKSQIACAFAAAITKMGKWPDGAPAPRGSVVFLSAEDSPTHALAPRLEAVGADRSKCHLQPSMIVTKDGKKLLNIRDDLKAISALVENIGDVRLLIVDPITAYIGGRDTTDSYRISDVRSTLTPLAEWAEQRGIAVIMITHFNKQGKGNVSARITDSGAFQHLARTILVCLREHDSFGGETDRRLLLNAKNSYAKPAPGYAYEIQEAVVHEDRLPIETSRVEWCERVSVTPDQALAQQEYKPRAAEAAATTLADWLAEGPLPAAEIEARTRNSVHSWRTMKQAKRELGVESHKMEFSGGWLWMLPEHDSEGANDDPF